MGSPSVACWSGQNPSSSSKSIGCGMGHLLCGTAAARVNKASQFSINGRHSAGELSVLAQPSLEWLSKLGNAARHEACRAAQPNFDNCNLMVVMVGLQRRQHPR